jgi:hypothetical protein
VLDPDFDFADMCDLPILRRHKPGPVPWEELDVDPDDFPLPRPPKPGPPTWEGLCDRQYRIRLLSSEGSGRSAGSRGGECDTARSASGCGGGERVGAGRARRPATLTGSSH